jgi:stress responsive alpha/beta barrel protein
MALNSIRSFCLAIVNNINGKNLISIFVLLISILIPDSGSATEPKAETLTHIVIIWLKPEFQSEEFIEKLLKANEGLRDIPQVLSMQTGDVIKSDRKIVDDSFDVGIMFTFNSEQDLKEYLEHPIHIKFLENYIKEKVERVVVYDF